MAVSMSATLTLPNPVIIMGQRFTLTLKVTEGGGTATNIISLSPYLLSADGRTVCANGRFGQIANSNTIANYTGAAMTVNSSSMTFNFDCVVDGPQMWGMSADANTGTYQVGVTCQTSDGSVFSPPPVTINAALPESGIAGSMSPAPNGLLNQSFILGTSVNQYTNTIGNNAFRFDVSSNAVTGLLLGFP